MFILTTISDLVQIPPHEFYKKSRDEVEDKLNEKYSDKVIQKTGLCIRMYDLLKVSDGLIGHGDGFVNINVDFRLIVFRPFKGEIITGKIAGSSKEGIRVTLEFFSDILVPPNLLFEGTKYDEAENVFTWRPAESEEAPFYFDEGDIVRFRVEEEKWHDNGPTGPVQSDKARQRLQELRERQLANGGLELGDAVVDFPVDEYVPPYSIIASMCTDGLGVVSWW